MVSRSAAKLPVLGRCRLASNDDVPMITSLLNESMRLNFLISSKHDVRHLIENAVLTICLLDVDEMVVGCLCCKEYPLIPSVHPNAWEEYLWAKYKAIELNARNTLFLHLLCWNTAYGRVAVDQMLKSVFMHDAYVDYIGFVKSLLKFQLLVPGQSRCEASFRKVLVTEKGIPGDQLPTLNIADRTEVSPRLRVRRAVEEDNDDVVPIIERHSKRLRELYGEFYVSELIARHPESDRVLLVCESKELAVGVMALNNQINFEVLEENYELTPFVGFRKPPEPTHDQLDEWSDLRSLVSMDMRQGDPSEDVVGDVFKKSRVSWVFEGGSFKSVLEQSTTAYPPSHFGTSVHLEVMDMLGDEEIEFDIVNINTDLLRVPQFLSYDTLRNQDEGPAGNIIKMLSIDIPAKDKPLPEIIKGPPAVPRVPPEPKRFAGASNAFLLELFAMHEDYDERYGFDMLEAAFALFPNRDYCIVCLPSNHASFPLLEHFTLVTPSTCRRRFCNDSLYVAHVNSVRGQLKVRPGEAYDLHSVYGIVEHAPRSKSVIELFKKSLTSPTLDAFMILNQNQPVGMVVLGPLEDGMAVRTQYLLGPESHRPGTDGTVLAGVVSPVVEPHNRWFMRELLRQSEYSTLFWMCLLFVKGDSNASRNLMSLAGHMTPVHPRRAVLHISRDNNQDKIYAELITPFSLWVLERPLTSLPKVNVNSSIVVVGSSCTGLAFLETLLLGPTSRYLTFSNVTLVSEHGLPTVAECLKAADTCIPRDGRYTDRYLKSIPFYFYFDVMPAVMVGIDRKKKCVLLKGGSSMQYDELVLTCGQQFQHPEFFEETSELSKEVERDKTCHRMHMDDPNYKPDEVVLPPETPTNVMVINSLYEANICLRKLMVMISEYKETAKCLSEDLPVVVYGDCLEAYSCIAALLELGIMPKMIVFVEPFPSEDPAQLRVNCFNNETVDKKVQETLNTMGIRTIRKNYLHSWRQHNMYVEYLNLMSTLQASRLHCFALFYFGLKVIDVYAFKAINQSGLVYDGGLVVGPSFETNDPHVFGAGTCVKYSRRLYASSRAHRYYSSEDVGQAVNMLSKFTLAHLFLKKLDPFVMGTSPSDDILPKYGSSLLRPSIARKSSSTGLSVVSPKVKWQPVMRFESPIVQSATLPGPLYYLKVRKPGKEIPMAVQKCLPHQGHTLRTDKSGNYFRLQLDNLHCVVGITYLSRTPFSSKILTQLYGKHEAFFNKLLIRYKMNQITDLYEFFTQSWMSAMYQDPFDNLMREINEHEIIAKAKEYFKVDIPSECGQSQTIRAAAANHWTAMDGERVVTSLLAAYLSRNSDVNPHYATTPQYFI